MNIQAIEILASLAVVAIGIISVVGVGGFVGYFANKFSTFESSKVRLVTKWDHLNRPIKWETNKEYKARLQSA